MWVYAGVDDAYGHPLACRDFVRLANVERAQMPLIVTDIVSLRRDGSKCYRCSRKRVGYHPCNYCKPHLRQSDRRAGIDSLNWRRTDHRIDSTCCFPWVVGIPLNADAWLLLIPVVPQAWE